MRTDGTAPQPLTQPAGQMTRCAGETDSMRVSMSSRRGGAAWGCWLEVTNLINPARRELGIRGKGIAVRYGDKWESQGQVGRVRLGGE